MPSSTPHQTNDENTVIQRATPQHGHSPKSPTRRVLGDISANVKIHAPGIASGKPMTGSPLKRSCTAAIEGGQGFTYLKKRKLSGDEVLSETHEAAETRGERGEERLKLGEKTMMAQQETPYLEIDIASPTEPNTPSDSGQDSNDSSDRKSFSSLINYDPSSQPGAGSSQQYQRTSKLVFTSVSHAELLRLRLRVAMYKIKTNQVDVPFAQLKVDGEASSRRSRTGAAVEEAVASLRRDAQASMLLQPRAPSLPKLLPGPVLLPTAYSSRMLYGQTRSSLSPISSPLKSGQQSESSTPRSVADRVARAESADLTSSVVKGRVAESLVGLWQGNSRPLQWSERR